MLFSEVAEASAAVSGTSSRTAKVQHVALALRAAQADGPETVRTVVSWLQGELRQRRTGLGWSAVRDLPAPATAPTLTVVEVDQAFARAEALSGPGSQAARRTLLTDLAGRATAAEQRLLRGLVSGELRQGAQEGVMLAAVANAAGVPEPAVRRAQTLAGDLGAVAVAALGTGGDGLAGFGLTVGVALAPMLAGSAPTVAEALARTGPAGVEWKLDGIRVQLHRSGDEVRIFTRSLDDVTDRMPEVVAAVRAGIPDRSVVDGEVLALHPDGRPRRFQDTASRTGTRSDPAAGAQTTQLTLFVFDALHLAGQDVLDEPGWVRRNALRDQVAGELLVPRLDVADPSDPGQVAAAEQFAADAVAAGHEGVVVKSDDAPYAMGRRGVGWVKVKPVHTLDLVVLAVEWGHGRRTGRLSNLHLGALDPDGRFGPPGGFVMLGKTFKGLTDALLAWQTERFLELAEGPTDGWVVRVRPEQVVEIALDGVQGSSRYPARMALRFARVVRYRDDKRASEADTVETVEALQAAQGG
ncbi:MAG: ATP-dependent DNA ligase [Actinomycetales bacterium]